MSNAQQLRAMVRLLGPQEMTPTAARQLIGMANQWDDADLVPEAERVNEGPRDLSRKLSNARAYPGMNGIPVEGNIRADE